MQQSDNRTLLYIYSAYLLTLSAFFTSSFFPELRLWGINHWAYLPEIWKYILFGTGLLIFAFVLLINNLKYDFENKLDSLTDRSFYLFSTIFITLSTACFIFFKVKTHFLGDGYQIISLLGSDQNHIKFIELGESLIHVLVLKLIGDTSQASALLSYQIVSITAGFFFVIVTAYFAKLLFKNNIERLLFFSGVCTGGYMLLYFGYVENYSLFVLSVLLYSFIGLLIAQGSMNRWYILPALFLSVFMHIMGVTLIPTTIYLILRNTILLSRFQRLQKPIKYSFLFIPMILISSVFYYFYSNFYFFRFSLVPLVADKFTVEGYTLFSDNHVIDFINLLFILIPSFFILTVAIYAKDVNKIFKHTSIRFLVLLILSTSGAAFIFDPKLGMPRDWDLFSFAGIPILIFLIYTIIKFNNKYYELFKVLILVITLNLFILIPRVTSQHSVEFSESLAHSFYNYDALKSINFVIEFEKYYIESNNSSMLNKIRKFKDDHYKHYGLNKYGLNLIDNDKFAEAVPFFQKSMEHHPSFFQAYLNLGITYHEMKIYDSSIYYLIIASGLNPFNPLARKYLGYTYYSAGDFEKAKYNFNHAINLVDSSAHPHIMLGRIFQKESKTENYIEELIKASEFKDSPTDVYIELGYYFYNINKYSKSAEFLKKAVNLGYPDKELQRMISQYPQLKPYFTQ